jgi:hypothetical protein
MQFGIATTDLYDHFARVGDKGNKITIVGCSGNSIEMDHDEPAETVQLYRFVNPSIDFVEEGLPRFWRAAVMLHRTIARV